MAAISQVNRRVGVFSWIWHLHEVLAIMTFVLAVIHLWLIHKFDPRAITFFLIPPFCAALDWQYAKSRTTRLLAGGFLSILVVGDVIAPIPGIFPNLSFYRELPLTQNRLLSWYAMMCVAYVVVILPPFLFTRPLIHHHRGQPTYFTRPTCYLGLATWLLAGPLMVWAWAGLLGLVRSLPK